MYCHILQEMRKVAFFFQYNMPVESELLNYKTFNGRNL